jgi:hypothetical protein
VFVSDCSSGGFGGPLYWRLAKNGRNAVDNKWPGAHKEEESKLNIVAALRVRVEPRVLRPEEKPKTPEYLPAKTAKTAEAERLDLVVTLSAKLGYVRPA